MPTIDTNTCTATGTRTGVHVSVCVLCFLYGDLLFHLLRFGLLRFINFSTSSAHHTTTATTVAATTTTIHIHPLKFIVCFVSPSCFSYSLFCIQLFCISESELTIFTFRSSRSATTTTIRQHLLPVTVFCRIY